MKFRTLIALSLALVMLLTLASPVLADRGRGSMLNMQTWDQTGTFTLSTTHDNQVKVAVSMTGMGPGDYNVRLQYDSQWVIIGSSTVSKRGTYKFSGVTSGAPFSGTVSFKVGVFYEGGHQFVSEPAYTELIFR